MKPDSLKRCAIRDTLQIDGALKSLGIAGDFPRALLQSDGAAECWADSAGRAVIVRVGWTALPLFEHSTAAAVVAWLSAQEGLRQIIVPESMAAPVCQWAKEQGAREAVIEILAEMTALRGERSNEPVLRATEADAARLAVLYPPASFNVIEFLPFKKRFELAVSSGRLYYVERNGIPAAACHSIAEADGFAVIMGVVTAPAWRKRGLARLVVSQLCADLLKENRRPRLMFESDNAITRTFYASLGFDSRARFVTIDLITQGVHA
jgi:GNAT superfamily N-acetyltransferase